MPRSSRRVNPSTRGRQLSQAMQDREVLDMRATGASLQTIADQYYNGHRSNAHRALVRIMEEHVAEGVDQLRAVQNLRLERMLERFFPAMLQELDPDHARIVLAVFERQAKLNGLDVKTDAASGNLTVVLDPGLTPGRMAEAEMVVDDVETGAR